MTRGQGPMLPNCTCGQGTVSPQLPRKEARSRPSARWPSMAHILQPPHLAHSGREAASEDASIRGVCYLR